MPKRPVPKYCIGFGVKFQPMMIFDKPIISEDSELAERHSLPEHQSKKMFEMKLKAQILSDFLTDINASAELKRKR